jgi:hypothetical protein
LTAIIAGAILTAALAFGFGNWGYALWLGVPFAIGALGGYGIRVPRFLVPALILTILLCLIGTTALMGLAGTFCGMVLSGIFSVPISFGTITGMLVRRQLKKSNFSQRAYLPVVAFAMIPVVWALCEGKNRVFEVERVSTEMVIATPPEDCWKSIMFYEEVTHQPPLILRVGLARPLHTTGSSAHVGDVKTCVYNKGRISKVVTGIDPGKRLAFDVCEQQIGYERDVRLIGGSFDLEPAPGGTRVTLTTVYQPLLAPRFCWRSGERIAVHILHGYVLEGMKAKAESMHAAALAPEGR